MLEFGLANQANITVITGEVGCGKTTLIRYLLGTLDKNTAVGLVTNTHRSFGDLLPWILLAFDLEYRDKEEVERYEILMDFLIEQYTSNGPTVLIIDEAQNMDAQTLEELCTLSNIDVDKDQIIQLVLVGQPELRSTLGRSDLTQFGQRVSANYHIDPLDEVTTEAYVRHRVSVAGGHNRIFRADCFEVIYKYSQGIPRLINLLCDTALLYAYAANQKTVSRDLIEQVIWDKRGNSILEIYDFRESDIDLTPPPASARRPTAPESIRNPPKKSRKSLRTSVEPPNPSVRLSNAAPRAAASVTEELPQYAVTNILPTAKRVSTVQTYPDPMQMDNMVAAVEAEHVVSQFEPPTLDASASAPRKAVRTAAIAAFALILLSVGAFVQHYRTAATQSEATRDTQQQNSVAHVEHTASPSSISTLPPHSVDRGGPASDEASGFTVEDVFGDGAAHLARPIFESLGTKEPPIYGNRNAETLAGGAPNDVGNEKAPDGNRKNIDADMLQPSFPSRKNLRVPHTVRQTVAVSRAQSEGPPEETVLRESADQRIDIPTSTADDDIEAQVELKHSMLSESGTEMLQDNAVEREKIALLERAESLHDANRLVRPKGGSAFDVHQQVLSLSPDHPDASEGIERTVETYEQWTTVAEKTGDLAATKHYYRRVLELSASDQFALRQLERLGKKTQSARVENSQSVVRDENTAQREPQKLGLQAKDDGFLKEIEDGDFSAVRLLLVAGASPNARGPYGFTALMLATINGHFNIVEELLRKDADINTQSEDGRTALMAAAWNGHGPIADLLLSRGADVNLTSADGWTALAYAAWKGHESIVKALLRHGADPTIQDGTGLTAIAIAKNQGRDQIADLIQASPTPN